MKDSYSFSMDCGTRQICIGTPDGGYLQFDGTKPEYAMALDFMAYAAKLLSSVPKEMIYRATGFTIETQDGLRISGGSLSK